MKKEYESIAKNVCQVSNWQSASEQDLDGVIGVACMLSFMKGTKANLLDLADNIGVDSQSVERAFSRLLIAIGTLWICARIALADLMGCFSI